MLQQKQPTEHGQQLIALGQTLQSLREAENAGAIVKTAINYLRSECDWDLIWMGLYDRRSHRLLGQGGATPQGDSHLLRGQFNVSPGDLMEQAIVGQKPLAVADLRSERQLGEWQRLAKPYQIQGTVIFPLRYKDLCLGVVWLGSHHWGMSLQAEEKYRLSMIFGQLAAALHHHEKEWQRQQAIDPHEPLLALLSQLQSPRSLDAGLEMAIEETHRFLKPSRTQIYWLDSERGYFWCRASNRTSTLMANRLQAATQISLQEFSGFYNALLEGRVVAVGESSSSLKTDATTRLMQQLEARSLLAAPIRYRDELLGFLAVEGKEARMWQEEEKHYIWGAACLVALAAPLSEMEATIKQVKLDQGLTARLTRAIATDRDWEATLAQCAQQLEARLNVQRTIVLLYNRDLNQFEITYQSSSPNGRAIDPHLPMLSYVDSQLIEASTEPIGLENWAGDGNNGTGPPYGVNSEVRLSAWRDVFTGAGVQSILLCSTHVGRELEGVLAVACETPRIWDRTDKEILQTVSQQIGLILHQWQLQCQCDGQERVIQTLQWGLTELLQMDCVDRIERLALEQIAKVLQVPLVALVTWSVDRPWGQVTQTIASEAGLALNGNRDIPIHQDSLLREALATRGVVGPLNVEDLPPETQEWLGKGGMTEVRAIALHTAPEHQPTGVLLVADGKPRQWSSQEMDVLDPLVSQLAWSRRTSALLNKLESTRDRLEVLNWYKHRRLEEFYWMVGTGIKQLRQLEGPVADMGNAQQESLQQVRYQQTLHQLSSTLTSLGQFLKKEQWQLVMATETIAIASLLKRTMDRVEPLVKQRQIWMKVHREGHAQIQGDRSKLESIFYELLLAAIGRSPIGGNIEIWYRPLPQDKTGNHGLFLELSVADRGKLNPRCFKDYQNGRTRDLLAPSWVDSPPGLHLLIYKQLMQTMGGHFNFYQLEEGRVVSRLLIPITRSS